MLDEEPLLTPLVVDDDPKGAASSGVRQRPGATPHYSTRARSVVLQVHDQIIRVSDEEKDEAGGDYDDDDNDGDDGRRLVVTSYAHGACGLRSFGHSMFWRFLGGLFKLVYLYYFFIWTIIYGGLALCFLISIVYEGWSTGEPLGTAAIVVSMLPVLNLLWIFFAFTLHALFVGVLWDFYDLGEYLETERRRSGPFARCVLTHPPPHHRVGAPRHPRPAHQPQRQDVLDLACGFPGQRPHPLLAAGLRRGDRQAGLGQVRGGERFVCGWMNR